MCQVHPHPTPLTTPELTHLLSSPSLASSMGHLHRTLSLEGGGGGLEGLVEGVVQWLERGRGEEGERLPRVEEVQEELRQLDTELSQSGPLTVVVGHGHLSPSSLGRTVQGGLVFQGLQHVGPAWQVLPFKQ